MSRSSVLRRALLLNSTRQWRNCSRQIAGGLLHPPPGAAGAPPSPWNRIFRGRSSVALNDFSSNHGSGGSNAYNATTGIYGSLRNPVRLPSDPCMDVTTFILDGKRSLEIGDTPALVDGKTGQTMNYADLRHAVCSIELGLVSIGVRQGDVVAMIAHNSIYYPVTFLATASIGGVLAAVNPLSSSEEIKRQLSISGARYIIVEQAFADKVAGLNLPVVIIENGERVKFDSAEVPFSDLLSSDPECNSAPETQIRQDDPAAILFSSGTTGSSKAVVLSHRNLMAQLMQLDAADDTEPGVHLCALPMCHVFGLVVITLQQLYRGGTVVVAPRFELNKAISCMEEHKVTHFYAVPNIILNLIKIMTTNSNHGSLSSLQRIMCGAAPLGKEKIDEFMKLFPHVSFVQIYGLTEASGATTLNNLREDHPTASVGTLLSSLEAKVLSSDKQPLGPNAQGELLLRGPSLMKGYANDNDANEATLDKDGWLRTGDLVNFDEEGRLFVVDRIKELIKYKAHQVAPAELEALLLTHHDILDAAIVPLPNEEVGQVPVAFVVQSSRGELTEDDVMNFVAQRVAPFKRVWQVLFVDEIPKTGTGKILRRQLASRF